MSLLVTFNKNTALGVLSFSIHHFCSIYNRSELTQVCIIKFEKKNERWKKNHGRETNNLI